MPLIAHNGLPAFERVRSEGRDLVGPEEASNDLPSIDVGLLNLMPDAALRATDRQFVRLVSAYQDEANLYVYPFTLAAGLRGPDARDHIREHYATFQQLRDSSLDAMIITGANPSHIDLADEAFWPGLTEVIDWAVDGVRSTLCSCLATHAVIRHRQEIDRTLLPQKRWGVYSHATVTDHFLLDGVGRPVEAPHSHLFNLTSEEFEESGAQVLVAGDEAGVHMAVSDDDGTFVFFQGHPEYDSISLLKEYEREIVRFTGGDRNDYPPFPDHYFEHDAIELLTEYRENTIDALAGGREVPEFPESSIPIAKTPAWSIAGMQIFKNWLADVSRRKGS